MKKPTKYGAPIIAIIGCLAIAAFFIIYYRHPASDCAAAVRFIPIVGDITATQDIDSSATSTPEADEDAILGELQSANNNPNVKVIVLLIDSDGGNPEAAEEITQIMGNIPKPKLALIRDAGDSAAYWIASAADKIFAFQSSDVGDIGVTASYLSDAQQNEDNGLQFVSLTSGPFKDTGNPDKPVTQADRDLLMKGVAEQYDIFVSAVAANRHLPVEQVKALADGSSFLGDDALNDGLIDSTGGWNALWQEIDSRLGKSCPADVNP